MNRCKHCGAELQKRFREAGECFSCQLWRQRAEVYPLGKMLVINGVMYIDAGKEPDSVSHTRGFGGREFGILKHDSTLINTNNLWCGGKVPKVWRPLLPDNAMFVLKRL